jgi:NCS2 family nucleobase:cation symporter-2
VISVFASIAMTGMKLVVSEEMNYRTTSIVGLSAALGIGIAESSAALSTFFAWFQTIFGQLSVVIATIVAVALNIMLPKRD